MRRREDLETEVLSLRQNNQVLGEQVKHLLRMEKKLYGIQNTLDLQVKRIKALNDFSLEATRGFDAIGTLKAALKLIHAIFPFDASASFLGDSESMSLAAVWGDEDEAPQLLERSPLLRSPDCPRILSCSLSASISPEMALLVEDTERHARTQLNRSLFRRLKDPLWLVIPLSHKEGGLMGLIVAAISTTKPMTRADMLPQPEDLPLFQLARSHVESALSNALLYQGIAQLVQERTSQLQNIQEQLAGTAKMAALGEMSGGVAHEINNPLATINLLAGQLTDLVEEPENIDRESLKGITSQIESMAFRIARIVKALLKFSRQESQEGFETESVQRVVDDTLALCQEKFKNASVELSVEPISGSMTISCNPIQISQVLLNLLNNSFDAIQNLPQKWIHVAAQDRGDQIEISVTDCGPGLSRETQERIFQPFFTTKGAGKGTGLGLSISRKIVESHDGTLSVDPSAPSTRFLIRLPKPKAEPRAA